LDELLEITTRYCTYHLQEKFSDAVNAAFKAMTDTTVCREPSMVCPCEPQAQAQTQAQKQNDPDPLHFECGIIRSSSPADKIPVYKIAVYVGGRMTNAPHPLSDGIKAVTHVNVNGQGFSRGSQYEPVPTTQPMWGTFLWKGARNGKVMIGELKLDAPDSKLATYTEKLYDGRQKTYDMVARCHNTDPQAGQPKLDTIRLRSRFLLGEGSRLWSLLSRPITLDAAR